MCCRVVLHVIAMADYDQDGPDPSDKLITTRDGIQTIALSSASIGRSANFPNLFLSPLESHIFCYVDALLTNPSLVSLRHICVLTWEILKELSCGTRILQLSYGFTRPVLLMQKVLSFILCMGMVSYLKRSVSVLRLRVPYM